MMKWLPPMVSTRTIGLAALLAAVPGSSWAEGPAPSGSYQATALGRVEVRSEGERLSVRMLEGGVCGFERGRHVLEGEFQGEVLVGRLTLCLRGNACPKVETVPVLAFYHPVARSLSAYVQLRSGCQSPMLEGAMLVLEPAAEASPSRKSYRGRGRKRDAEAARKALEQGSRLLRQQDWGGAVTWFERSLSHDDSNWVTFFSLGTAHLMGGQAREAISALERARELHARNPDIPYHLACAYARLRDKSASLAHLRQAVDLGYAIPAGMFPDPPLDRFLGSEAEYLGLANRAVENYKAAAGRRQPSGP